MAELAHPGAHRPRYRPGARRAAVASRIPAALATAVAVEIGLRVTTLPRLCAALGVALAAGTRTAEQGDVLLTGRDRAGWRAAQRVVAGWPWARDRQCLRLALVAGRLLRHHRPTLHLGVARVDGAAAAHAWLTAGRTVLDTVDDTHRRYLPLAARSA
ncbi:MAG: lasso peptide biosynthesis B2 protein [Pseudonocardia sp.]